ncbi:hypothetical protein [Jeotgalibacillus proteolyticus]|uniref:hypothetical protein n=1 Tax=Jeotgalibacillus proteolyticus TaxID=2082395 RepID=UPI003CF81DA9
MYSTETLPIWFWAANYLFIALTAASAIFSMVQKKNTAAALIVLLITFIIPVVHVANGISRPEGQNEIEYWFDAVQKGAAWAVFILAGFSLQLVWWGWFLLKFKPWQSLNAASDGK